MIYFGEPPTDRELSDLGFWDSVAIMGAHEFIAQLLADPAALRAQANADENFNLGEVAARQGANLADHLLRERIKRLTPPEPMKPVQDSDVSESPTVEP